jgi:hypothetical protein
MFRRSTIQIRDTSHMACFHQVQLLIRPAQSHHFYDVYHHTVILKSIYDVYHHTCALLCMI